MFTCPICNAVLRETDLRRRHCPSCAGVLSWEEPSDEGPRRASAPGDAPAPASYQDILRTVIDQSDVRPAPRPADPAPQPAPRHGPPPAREESAIDRVLRTVAERVQHHLDEPIDDAPQDPPQSPVRFDGAEPGPPPVNTPAIADPDLRQHVRAIWRHTAPDSAPRMTIKTAGGGVAASSSLVIRNQRIAREDDVDAADADYQILEVIGEGGVGVVFASRQRSIDRTVALKTLKDPFPINTIQQEKFLAEAVVTAELDHPNIVPIYDLGRDEQGALFYSMKRVQGTPWSQVIHKKSLTENVEILLKVADAVAFGHARGVVHRDLKPENVMLGGFGEVLVMDWGIALPTKSFSKVDSINASTGMGGTPAYMAPEMAIGPLSAIGPASDIYLLGAILYEIVTGNPPHLGRTVLECLEAAARNEIVPADQQGELVEIALRAMASHPRDRHASVQEFQAAIRLYQSHSESIVLAHRAGEDLRRAKESGDYQDYARALFAYQEALALWDANSTAREGVSTAQLAYAQHALDSGDFDLGLSLLSPRNPRHAELRRKLEAAQKERNVRQRRLKAAMWTVGALAATVFVVIVVAFHETSKARHKTELTNQELVAANDNLKVARTEAEAKRIEAETQRSEAETQRNEARAAQTRAETAETQAKADQQRAEEAKQEAELARQREEQQGYIAQIGLASEKIQGNAFDDARGILRTYSPPEASSDKAALRGWEWGRLSYLTRLAVRSFLVPDRVEAIAVTRDGGRIVMGGQRGEAHVIDPTLVPLGGRPRDTRVLRHGGPIFALAISPDDAFVATAGAGGVKIWRLSGDDTQAYKSLPGGAGDVLSVAFSPDGATLLTGAADTTARLWDWQRETQIRAFRGHHDAVHCAAFSHDGRRIATAGEDRVVTVWENKPDGRRWRFYGHQAPVYAVAFSQPDSQGVERVASAGYDKNILIWNPDELRPFDFRVLDSLARPESAQSEPIRSHPPFRTLEGHDGAVRWLQFSADGSRLASAGHDNTARIWRLDAQPGEPHFMQVLRGHGGWIKTGIYVAEAERILTAGYDQSVKVWNPAAYEEMRVLEGHQDAVMQASISAQGDRVVTAGRDRVARIWPLDGGEPTALEEGPAFLALGAVYSDDGRLLVTSAADSTVRKWSCDTGGQEPFARAAAIQGAGRRGAAALTRDGRQILTGSEDNLLQVWDAESGERLAALSGHLGEVTAIDVSRDDRLMVSGDARGLAIVWRRGDDGLWTELAQLKGHSPGYEITAVRILPDGSRALTASQDNSVGQWRLPDGEEIVERALKHPDSVQSLDVSSDGRWALTTCADGAARIWSLDSARERVLTRAAETVLAAALSPVEPLAMVALQGGAFRLIVLQDRGEGQPPQVVTERAWHPQSSAGDVRAIVFSPDGESAVTVAGNQARQWDMQTGVRTRTFSPNGVISSAHFAPAGDRVVTSGWDGMVKVWDAAGAKVLRQILDAHQGRRVHWAMFSPIAGDDLLLTGGEDGVARLWSAATGEPRGLFDRHAGAVRCGAFTPDGRLAATAGDEGAAWIWPVDPGRDAAAPVQLLAPGGSPRPLRCVALTGGAAAAGFEDRVLTGGEDNVARIWSLRGELLHSLHGHTASVTAVAFSPDGRRALTASDDNTAKLWDTQSGKEILTLSQHTQGLTAAGFSPDGLTALTASLDATAILWPALPWTESAAPAETALRSGPR